MTLKGPNDFKLEDFHAASSELFEPYYGKHTKLFSFKNNNILNGCMVFFKNINYLRIGKTGSIGIRKMAFLLLTNILKYFLLKRG